MEKVWKRGDNCFPRPLLSTTLSAIFPTLYLLSITSMSHFSISSACLVDDLVEESAALENRKLILGKLAFQKKNDMMLHQRPEEDNKVALAWDGRASSW